jgi:hypothetical protein
MISATICIVSVTKPTSKINLNGQTMGFQPPEPDRSPVRYASWKWANRPQVIHVTVGKMTKVRPMRSKYLMRGLVRLS